MKNLIIIYLLNSSKIIESFIYLDITQTRIGEKIMFNKTQHHGPHQGKKGGIRPDKIYTHLGAKTVKDPATREAMLTLLSQDCTKSHEIDEYLNQKTGMPIDEYVNRLRQAGIPLMPPKQYGLSAQELEDEECGLEAQAKRFSLPIQGPGLASLVIRSNAPDYLRHDVELKYEENNPKSGWQRPTPGRFGVKERTYGIHIFGSCDATVTEVVEAYHKLEKIARKR